MLDNEPTKFQDMILIIGCEEDASQVSGFLKNGWRVHSNEVLLTGILTGKLDLKGFQLILPQKGGHNKRKK